MDSGEHAEQLTARICRIISAVGWWGWASRWDPDTEDVERAGRIRKEVAALVARLLALDLVLGEEIAAAEEAIRERGARQEPGADVLAGVEG